MKKIYNAPNLEIDKFLADDIICTSSQMQVLEAEGTSTGEVEFPVILSYSQTD